MYVLCGWEILNVCILMHSVHDRSKHFDLVTWPFLLEVLQDLGFVPIWRDAVGGMLASSSTQVLLMGFLVTLLLGVDYVRVIPYHVVHHGYGRARTHDFKGSQ